ncbi:MAG TPA: 4Fe-4S binding protein, partial [Myxococcota bacterium]|nr:4Fe-4S binding protein [Myxococcota bacterium]
GMQVYAVPGKLNQTWVKIDRPGIYYGQCNQICGTNHSFMPIVIRAVPEAEFTATCTRCLACIEACPEDTLALDNGG